MENKEEQKNEDQKSVNLVIKAEDTDQGGDIIVSVAGIIRKLKKFLALWLAVTILLSVLTVLAGTLLNINKHKEISVFIGFQYDGIDRGVDPKGNKFNANDVKNSEVLKAALDRLGMYDEHYEEAIRYGITVNGIVPQKVNERINAYTEIAKTGNNGAMTAVEKVLETTYYPTRFEVCFNYAETPFTAKEAALVLNTIVDEYGMYFRKTYGYNDFVGSAIYNIDTEHYDYAQTIDVIDDSIDSIRSYVSQLERDDNIRFISSSGVTFADIDRNLSTLKSVDEDLISSYITQNVITKDKELLKTYYQYRIEDLQRRENINRENLASVTEAIANYQKNTVQIFGAGTETMNTTATEASEAYDKLFERKLSVQNDLSTTVQRISMYKTRLERLNSGVVCTPAMCSRTEEDLDRLIVRVQEILDTVREAADEFYTTKVFSKSYNVLVPASASPLKYIKGAVKDSILYLIIIDGLVFVAFFGAAVVDSCVEEYNKKNGIVPSKKKKSVKTK